MQTISDELTPRILPDPDMPPEVRDALLPIIRTLKAFVPTWVHELRLDYDGRDAEAAARCYVKPEYRWMRVTVCGTWLEEPEEDRAGIVLHEILHAHTRALVGMAEGLIAELAKKDGDSDVLKTVLTEHLRQTNESVACDLTAAFVAALYTHPGSVGRIATSGE